MSCYRHTNAVTGQCSAHAVSETVATELTVELPASGRRSATVDCNGISQSAARIAVAAIAHFHVC
jgi:hypothetical protein